jgi:hypothetical protein
MTTPSRLVRLAAPAVASLLLAGCGPAAAPLTTAGEPEYGEVLQALSADSSVANKVSTNGLSMNGLSMNGLSMNGLSMNGLSMNGLTAATLSSTGFKTWFDLAPTLNDVLMKYVVRCAAPASSSYSYYSATAKKTFTWSGVLGLTPAWASGATMSSADQQLITACLAAHVNKFAIPTPISVQGADANGLPVVNAPNELSLFPQREACFFGNLFTGDGFLAGIDHAAWSATTSDERGCVFDFAAVGTTRDCPPIQVVGRCSQICQANTAGTGYTTCTWNGKSYRALATRIDTATLATCGNGVCEPSERCGTGTTWDSCKADCGTCP